MTFNKFVILLSCSNVWESNFDLCDVLIKHLLKHSVENIFHIRMQRRVNMQKSVSHFQ